MPSVKETMEYGRRSPEGTIIGISHRLENAVTWMDQANSEMARQGFSERWELVQRKTITVVLDWEDADE
jgi:hypothetical protein